MLDNTRSRSLAENMGDNYNPECCWANALQALRLYQKQLKGAVYVEGWCAVLDVLSVQEHGWLELGGTILDPTYPAQESEEGMQWYYAYFPALRYTLEDLKGVRLRSLPHVWRTGGFGGLRNEAYRAAMEKAAELVR